MTIDLQRKRDLGKILDDSFALYRANFRTLLLLAAAVVIPVHLLVYGVGLGWLWSDYPAAPDGVRIGDLAEQAGGLAAQLLVVTPLVTAMTVYVVREAAREGKASAGAAFRAGLDVFAPLFGAVLLTAAGVALGLLALIVPGIILAVRWVVVPQTVVIEGRSGTDALRRSLELTRGKAWFAAFVLITANLIVGLLSAIALVPLESAARSADTLALSMVGQMVGAIFSVPLLAVAYTLLYYALLAERGERPSDGVPAPSPGRSVPAGEPAGSLEGVPGTFGDGWAPPTPPARAPGPPS